MVLGLVKALFGETPPQTAGEPTQADALSAQQKAQALSALFGSVQPQGEEVDPQELLAGRVARVEINQQLDAAKAEIEAQNPHITDEQFNDFIEALTAGDMGKAWSITEAANKAKLEAEQSEREQELKNVHTEGAPRGDAQLNEAPPQTAEEGMQRSIARFTK